MNHPDIEQIYTEYRDRVMGYIYARLRSSADAEDLCQDVFVKLNKKLDSFDSGKASISTWIYSITRNSVIDFYRGSHPHEEIDENMAQEGAIDDSLLNDETLGELLWENWRKRWKSSLPSFGRSSFAGIMMGCRLQK